ncbi:MAG: hypothetical protein SFY32_02180 [Bacteroidota bacterium]|nr:hypothetical protein [Bacteroidota bacterium]
MFKTLSVAISILLHPFLIPVYIYTVIVLCTPYLLPPLPFATMIMFLVFMLIICFIIPALLIFIMYRLRLIESLHLNEITDRIKAFFCTIPIYVLSVYVMYSKFQFTGLAMAIQSTVLISMFVSGIITFFWKISLHSMSVTGLVYFVGYLAAVYKIELLYFTFLILLIVAGLLMSARLYLGAHNLSQIGAGMFLGLFLSVFGTLFFI